MSRSIHITAAANQLTRKLFDNTDLEGCVAVENGGLEVLVLGSWTGNRLGNFAGYAVTWRESSAAA